MNGQTARSKRGPLAAFVAHFFPPPSPPPDRAALERATRRTRELEARLDALLLLADTTVSPYVSLPEPGSEPESEAGP